MIHFDTVPKPQGFEQEVEKPGAEWLLQNPSGRPQDYWARFKADLADGFNSLCAYTAMYEPVGTVDHFVSVSEKRSRAYDWSNYRFSAGWINSSKSNLLSSQILDPFQVEDGWFEILLPSLQLVVSADIPEDIRTRAEFVLKRLHLGHDERVIRQRREWYRMFQDDELTLEGLKRKAPLIAAAVEKAEVDQ